MTRHFKNKQCFKDGRLTRKGPAIFKFSNLRRVKDCAISTTSGTQYVEEVSSLVTPWYHTKIYFRNFVLNNKI